LALPLLGAALALAIGRALAPLRALADAVGSRDAQRLEPVVAPDAPREVRPLVERLNALFRRIGESLEKERAFTADAAHELRTPIAGIRAQAQVAREATEDAERRRALDQVLAGCDRAARLAEQLLTLARLDAGQGQLRLVPCDLAQIAREVLAELAPGAHSRGTALALAADAPVPVAGDALLLHVLVRNLVDNAVRYGGPEGAVTVTVERDEEGSRLCVADRGPGIPSAERQRVLDRFYRSVGTREQGAGLGLSIVSRIAALHGAALELDEGPEGHGLCASVRFPAPGERRPSG
jgi:two-component system sensor histidine kinase QseC